MRIRRHSRCGNRRHRRENIKGYGHGRCGLCGGFVGFLARRIRAAQQSGLQPGKRDDRRSNELKTVLTVAGSDCSGRGGYTGRYQDDCGARRICDERDYSAYSAKTQRAWRAVMDVTPEFLRQQLDCHLTDIRPDAVKIGMVSDANLICVIADALREYDAPNVVLDPVMVSTSGSRCLKEDAQDAMAKRLLPLADLITPNIPEAQALWGVP